MTTEARKPHALRTPTEEAGYLLARAQLVCNEIFEDHSGELFQQKLAMPMWNGTARERTGLVTDGDMLVEELFVEGNHHYAKLILLTIVIAYGTQALEADAAGEVNAAWAYLADGNYWMGVLKAIGTERNEMSERARKAADAKHAENRAAKADARAWYEAHRHEYPSLDSAAEAISRTIVPMTFRTVRDWISQWEKELRSARKP